MKKSLVWLMVMALVISLVGCGTSDSTDNGEPQTKVQETYKFTLSLDSSEDSVTYIYSQKFKEELEALTDGHAVVQIFANGTMGGDVEAVESCQNGEIDFVALTTAPMVNFVPELAVFDMPSVFPNIEVARKVVDGSFLDKLGEKYEANGFKILGFADQGFRTMSTNKEIKSLADFGGQKIRTMQNPYHLAYWKALGANPTPMAFAEVYIGLQQGTIDAQENPYEVIVAGKLYEQQAYVYNTNHVIHLVSLITNKDKYNGLPTDIQTAIDDAANTAKLYAREQADARIAERIEIMESDNTEILDLSPDLLAEMKTAAEPVYDQIRQAIGDELVDALLNETK